MSDRKFQRRVEDFVCEHCGAAIIGSGYTNHCPRCLWSKHVDVNPGDRAAACGGLMEPVALEGSSPAYTVVHRCVKCGEKRRNRAEQNDDAASLVALAGKAQ